MRIKFSRLITFIVFALLFANLIVFYYTLRQFFQSNYFRNNPSTVRTTKPPIKHVSRLVTIIIREFELNENDVSATVQSILNVFPNIQILIVYDTKPYPPLDILSYPNSSLKNVKGVDLSLSLKIGFNEHYPLNQVRTKFVLFLPDSSRITSRQVVQNMVNELVKNPEELIVTPFNSNRDLNCLSVNINIREWTLKYSLSKGTICDGVSGGKHAILAAIDSLRKLPHVFLQPFPQSLYIQTAAIFIKVKIVKNSYFLDGKPLRKSHHAQWKFKQLEQQRLKLLYRNFNIKQVVRETGLTEWYGCTRDTPRCFGPVIDSMPSYLFEGKWTPPCCLSNLRKTARHVVNHLTESGIRYWLEAGSLLGAMRSGDILPWDHDVDIGFNSDDLIRSVWLTKAHNKPIVDSKGFLWEKATEGNFYRVYYSKTNKIYVNLLPFYLRNGTMVKDGWFTNHKNMEFPENFLHPMSSIDFIGRQIPSPNNIRDFLELKFGKGAIETPEYPDPSRLAFP